MSPPFRLAILFRNFGPYHVARIRAAAERGAVVAIEGSDVDPTYGWTRPPGNGVRWSTLFTGSRLEDHPTNKIRDVLSHSLDAEAPSAVAVPGWSDKLAISALAWARRRSVPVVLMSDSARRDARRTVLTEWVKARLVRLYQAALVGGVRHKEYVRDLGMPESTIHLGYDVVDVAHFSKNAADARGHGPEWRQCLALPARYWLACARFIPKKNLHRLLAAYGRYSRERGQDAWDLVILGDGPGRKDLERARAQAGLQGRVLLPGFIQYDALPAYYALAEGFILPSTSEQWGLVVNEAMACGIPVLVSERCGCVPELVPEAVTGFRFDPFLADGLAELMLRVDSMGPERRRAMGEAGSRLVTDWGPGRFARGLWAAVEDALAAGSRTRSPIDQVLLTGMLNR